MARKPRDLRASDVVSLLRRERVQGYCFDEVGVDGGRLRFDLLEVRHDGRDSLIGSEIKVNRSDYRADDKWPGYLDYCHELWFVAPPDVITPDDLVDIDPDVGLLHVHERHHEHRGHGATRRWLTVVRRAKRRPMDPTIEAAVLYTLVGGRGGRPRKAV